MPDGWEAAYSAKTSSKKRNLHRRRLRQLGEVGEVEFVSARTREELEPLLEEAFHLHELRWRGRPGRLDVRHRDRAASSIAPRCGGSPTTASSSS